MTYEKYIKKWLLREKLPRQYSNMYIVKANGLEFLVFNYSADTHLIAIQDKEGNLL